MTQSAERRHGGLLALVRAGRRAGAVLLVRRSGESETVASFARQIADARVGDLELAAGADEEGERARARQRPQLAFEQGLAVAGGLDAAAADGHVHREPLRRLDG